MSGSDRSAAKTVVIAALAKGSKIADTALEAGVDERTIYRWKREPEFQTQVSRLRAEMFDRAAGSLSDAVTEAVKTFRDLLSSDKPEIQARAAKEILAFSLTFRQNLDFEERLRRLEEQSGTADAP